LLEGEHVVLCPVLLEVEVLDGGQAEDFGGLLELLVSFDLNLDLRLSLGLLLLLGAVLHSLLEGGELSRSGFVK